MCLDTASEMSTWSILSIINDSLMTSQFSDLIRVKVKFGVRVWLDLQSWGQARGWSHTEN